MDTSADLQDPILDEIVRRLVCEFAPERIYLFGSQARGDAGPDSDYDLMVVVGKRGKPGYELAERAQEVLWGVPKGADVLVWDRASFEGPAHLKSSLPATILREGLLLYRAA